MKNLSLWDVSVKNTHLNLNKSSICYSNDDSSCGELYICSVNLVVNKIGENGESKWKINLADHECAPVNICFLTLPKLLCVGLSNGDIYTINDCDNNIEIVGKCDHGLSAMEWSPDQELLVLVTKELNTILMSCTFDPINEQNLLSAEFGEKQFITVGWGKKETQFHGSAGKQAAKLKDEVKCDPENNANETVKISWRGDGQLFATAFTVDGVRRFKVFDREGNLQYTSEKQQGLEANLSWRPSGNVIATTQKLQDKYVVSFFEKNGLKHGDFVIPVNSNTYVEDIAWSSDSEILVLQCKDLDTDTQTLLLFTTSNYHWYLKQTLTFDKQQTICKILWDNDFDAINNKKLHVVLDSGQHLSYTWIWNVDHSLDKNRSDDALVSVIDGKKILVTGFRQTVVPPPMASFEIELHSFVNSIHFSSHIKGDSNECNNFFVCTSDSKLVFFEQVQKLPLKYDTVKTIQIDKDEFPFQNYGWHWLNNDTITCISLNGNCYYLIEYRIKENSIIKMNTESLAAAVARTHLNPSDSSSLFLQLINGDIMKYTIGGSLEPQDVSFGRPCVKFNVFTIDNDLYFIGLSHKGILYINGEAIMSSVSSFYIHTYFLLITTLQHVLLIIELTKEGIGDIMNYTRKESNNVYKRKIERGAKLVISVPCGTRTVLQMPRGNLEAIQPRPLSLKTVGEYLDRLDYYEAFDLMRKERINLNLIYDHNPTKFLSTVDVFLEAIKNNNWLCLFLSDLENIDVTKSMYSSSYVHKTSTEENGSKVDRICDIIRLHILKTSDNKSKVLPILTSYVKKNTVTDLETALTVIKDLKSEELNGTKLPVGSDEALKYLLYMVDVNKLFDVALGMYDFDLVLLVANKSQMDPKEYIPMLNEFNEMEGNYQKFSINKHLKRFDKAVECLANCGEDKHEELRTFVKYHSLYREALKLFESKDEIFKQISSDFGQYLCLKKHFIEAGIVYERAEHADKAVNCYKDALEWEMAIKLAFKWPENQFNELCMNLVQLLKEEKRHKEALIILEQFCSNEETVNYAIENCQYKSALRLCAQYDKVENQKERLKEAIMVEYKNLRDLIENNWNMFIRHKTRLALVREIKIKNQSEFQDLSYCNKDSDLYSDAGSTVASSTSRGSSRSFRSSKNRRKHERKVASLKEGSQFEDVALAMALHTLVNSTFDLRLQVKEVVIVLSNLEKDAEALILQTSLDKLLKDMKDSFKEIWTNDLLLEATNAAIAAQDLFEMGNVLPQGIASLEPHLRIAPVIQDINWKLDGLK